MKQLRALQNTPHCTGTKSYARLSHKEVCAPIYSIHINVNILYMQTCVIMIYSFGRLLRMALLLREHKRT